MEINKIVIYNNKKEPLVINSLENLISLSDLSVLVMINNSNYIATVYLYTLNKFNMFLEYAGYNSKERSYYFKKCFQSLHSFMEYQEKFLIDNSQILDDIDFSELPKKVELLHGYALCEVCSFFSGILSTTSYLDENLIPTKEKQTMRHNYGNIISYLIRNKLRQTMNS